MALSRTLLALAVAIAALAPLESGAKVRWQPLARESGPGADTTIVGFGVNAVDATPEPTRFVCRCREGALELYAVADTGIVGQGASRSVSVFIDREPARYESWLTSSNGRSLFAREPEALAQRLREASSLELGVRVNGGRTATLRFDVRGFDGVMRKVELACPPAPPRPSPIVTRPSAPPPPGDQLPAYGEYVYVEELPEAITKAMPEYPSDFRMEGTVVVQALVGTEGRVIETKVVKSVPILDEAAIAAVKKWVFKPAMANGRPVAVWVAVPVKFSAP